MKYTSYRNLIYLYILWWIGWIVLQTLIVQYSFKLSLQLALLDALLTNVMLTLAGYVMVNIIRFYKPRKHYILIYSIALSIVSVYALQFLCETFLDDPVFTDYLYKSFFVEVLFSWLMISLTTGSAWLWFYLRDQQEAEARRADNEKLAREAELSKLRQQLQPHFLFNSLNSISALVVVKPEEARKMIHQLSDFLRGTLRKEDQQLITLSEELQHLELYLEIEKVRFGHRLKTTSTHDENALALKLPLLLLQPIVENAIKFGLYDTIGDIIIRLDARSESNYLVITIENPYDSQTSLPRQGTGFGLNSVQRRLFLLYGRHDLLSTSKDDVTFTTTVKIPQTL